MKARLSAALVLVLLAAAGCSDNSTSPGQSVVRTIDDLNYVHGRFFFVVRPARTLSDGGTVDIATLRVWRDDLNGSNNQGTVAGYGEVDATAPAAPARRVAGRFDQLQPLTDYSVSTQMYGDRFPVLELVQPLAQGGMLGVSYEETLPGGSRRTVGTVDPSGVDTIRVQLLLAPRDLYFADADNNDFYEDDLSIAPFNQVREFELKNVYDLQARNIDPATFHLEVRRYDANLDEPNDQVNDDGILTGYIQILGLDLFKDAGNGTPLLGPDGSVDRFNYANFVDLERGLVFLPDLRPFDPRIAGRPDARPEEDLFWKSRMPGVDASVPGLRRLVLWPQGLANPPGSSQSTTPPALRSNPNVYDKRNQLPAADRRYYLYAKFNGAVD